MGFFQKFFKFFMSEETFSRAREESQQWYFTCDCGHEFTIWDIGGIRYRAKGNPIMAARCPKCNRVKARKLQKR